MNRRIITAAVAVCLVAVLVLSLAGCSMVSVNEERKQDQTVAVVNGVELKYSEYENLLNQYLYYNYGYTVNEYEQLDSESLESIQGVVLKELVYQELEYQDAIATGYALTDDEKAALEEEFREDVQTTQDNYRSNLESSGNYTEEEIDSMTEEYINAQLGEYFDWDEALERVYKQEVVGNYEQAIRDSVEVTDEEVREDYDNNVENQKLMLENETYGMLTTLSDSPVLVYPDDVRRAQHLLIGIDTETRNTITSYRSAGETEKADALRDESLAAIRDEAEQVLSEINAEKDVDAEKFAEYMDEYSDDTQAVNNEEYRTQGYIFHQYSSTEDYPQEVIDAALALEEEGQISDLVASDYGYSILRLTEFPETVVPYEDVYDTIHDSLLEQRQSEAVNENREALLEAGDVTYYYDRVKIEGQV